MIESQLENRVCRIRINRPQQSNAFTQRMTAQLTEILRGMAREADIVVIEAAGADFCIGRDRSDPPQGTPFEVFKRVSDLNRALATFPGVSIVSVHGRAHGFSVGLVMRADLAFVADDARFLLDEVRHGIAPTFIMEEILQHLPLKRALDVVLSGREWGAHEALEMGLISRVVPGKQLDPCVAGFVDELRQRDRRAVLKCKKYMLKVRDMSRDARHAYALVETMQFMSER
jgi:enoyl-CoA hydratase